MRRAYWTYAILAATSIAAATPAVSQTVRIGPDGIKLVPQEDARRGERREMRQGVSEREAIRIAKRQGLRDVDAVTKTRDTYRVAGIDRRGRDIRVDIDRDSGQVIRVR